MMRFSAKAFSTVEILLAGALFTVFSWGVLSVLLSGLVLNRQGQELTIATAYAVEGLEAVRLIARDDFTRMETREGEGLVSHDGQWDWQATPDEFDNFYIRTVNVRKVERDGDGHIVDEGGSEDPDIFRVTVIVSWPTSPERTQSVMLETYLSHWRI